MNDLHIGNFKTGNFRVNAYGNPDINNYKIERHDDKLFLVNTNKKKGKAEQPVELEPVDEIAYQIIAEFDEYLDENNSSIYQLSLNNRILTIALYEYLGPKRLTHDNEHMYIYADRQIEKFILENEDYKSLEFIDRKGFLRRIKTEQDVVEFFYEQFMSNRSIFVHEDRKNKGNPHRFQMFGKQYRVQVDMVRNGVYEISKIFKTNNSEYAFELYQIFGNIEFVTFTEQTKIKTASLSSENVLQISNPSKVFEAWNQYMDFKEQIYRDELSNSQLFKYNKIDLDTKDMTIVINLEDDADISDEERKNIEYELITAENLIPGYDLPTTLNQVIEYKKAKDSYYYICSLGKCLNQDYSTNKMIFNIPEHYSQLYNNSKGVLYISDASLRVEKWRRDQVARAIQKRDNPTTKTILDLTDPNVKDLRVGRGREAVTDKMLRAMFGKKDVKLTANYMKAMDISLNTPDIALIQGPPGTGKTTLINGLVSRLSSLSDNIKVLVSSEQHDALENVIEKMSDKNFPPFISSSRKTVNFDEEVDSRQDKNIRKLQENMIAMCNELLRDNKDNNDYTNNMKKLALLVKDIRISYYGMNTILEKYDELKNIILSLGYYSKVTQEFGLLTEALFQKDNDINTMSFDRKLIMNKIKAQRIDFQAYISDDGSMQLIDLQEKLKKYGYNDYLMSQDLYEKLLSNDVDTVKSNFDSYITYVENIDEKFVPKVGANKRKEYDFKNICEALYGKILELAKDHTNSFFDIVQDLKYKLADYDNVKCLIQKYTDIVGSTCAQAAKTTKYIQSSQKGRFNYVIIDEAARANPLDIMIPLMMGINVIMVGDHKQLPHYIESDIKRRFERESSLYDKKFDKTLLTKSLFEIMFENLDKAFKEGRIAFPRTVTLDEQHRMNPNIGNFISQEFYGGELQNAEDTKNKNNDYQVFDGKNIVFIDVDKKKGDYEYIKHSSYYRESEIDKIVDIVKEIVSKNPEKFTENLTKKEKIGILSFYNEQMDMLNERFKNEFPHQTLSNISFGTVDSFQGKEFDIVILSCVRCNRYSTAEKALGFIEYCDSRVNVAMSRAIKLLIVVGDAETFSKNKHFDAFINKTKEIGGFYD